MMHKQKQQDKLGITVTDHGGSSHAMDTHVPWKYGPGCLMRGRWPRGSRQPCLVVYRIKTCFSKYPKSDAIFLQVTCLALKGVPESVRRVPKGYDNMGLRRPIMFRT